VTSLRFVGLAAGCAGFLTVFLRFRHGRARRSDFLFGSILSLGLAAISLKPDLVNALRDMLALEREQFSRLIAIAIVSNLLLWVLLFYTRFRTSDQLEKFDLLVRELGVAEFERRNPHLEKLPEVVIVIPAFDEEENIGAVLAEMPRSVCGKEAIALVIDDGSRDRTAAVASAAGFPVVRTPLRRGGGAALRTGFDIASRHGAEIVVTMDADGQHLPAEIERLVGPIADGSSDFVIGSRLLGSYESDSRMRSFGIPLFNAVIRLLTPLRVTDCSNGFRAFRVSELERLTLRQDQFHTSELLIEAARKRVRISEAPVTVKLRRSGSSKKGKNLSYGVSFARAILKTWWR
jgi:hypothetical protein